MNTTQSAEEVLEQLLREAEDAFTRARVELVRARENLEAADNERFGLRRALARVRGEELPLRRPIRSAAEDRRAYEMGRLHAQRAATQAEADARAAWLKAAEDQRARAQLDAYEEARLMARVGEAPPVESVDVRPRKRAEAVEQILGGAPRPLGRREILAELKRLGREDDSPDAVSTTLSYLASVKRAVKVADGSWTTPARWEQLAQAHTEDDDGSAHAGDERDDDVRESTAQRDESG